MKRITTSLCFYENLHTFNEMTACPHISRAAQLYIRRCIVLGVFPKMSSYPSMSGIAAAHREINGWNGRLRNTCMERNHAEGRTNRSEVVSYYHYLPVVSYDSHDVLQRFGKVKVEDTSFTISESYEPVVIAPLIYEQAEPDQQLILIQQFDVIPFEILTMTIERIFIDKLFAAEAYTRSAAQEYRAFEASKHIYDLAVISHEPRIVSLLQDEEQLTKLLTIRLTEEKNRLDGIPGVLPKDFTFFEKSCADTHIIKAYATMQNQYVFIPDDRIPLDEAQYRLHGLQDQLNQNPAWRLTAIPQ